MFIYHMHTLIMQIIKRIQKQYEHVVKQERVVQRMIDDNDIPNLAKLITGRGTGKLFISAPSQYVQDEWMNYLQLCCDGQFDTHSNEDSASIDNIGKSLDKDIFFSGTLEKAARRNDGTVGGWKSRYFVLGNTTLTYFTKAKGGVMKGSIRVLGGAVRKGVLDDNDHHQYCIELEEGRDISLMDPDLINEAKRQVHKAKRIEIEMHLMQGIKARSLPLITRMIDLAKKTDILIDFSLLNEAKSVLHRLRGNNLKRDLYFTSKLVLRSQLAGLVSLADELSVDPDILSYRTVRILAQLSEIDQNLLSARGALCIHDDYLFTKAFVAILRFDPLQLSSIQKYQLVALVLQHCGYRIQKHIYNGYPLKQMISSIRRALNCCTQLLVETESMDLARLMILFMQKKMTMMMKAPKSDINPKSSIIIFNTFKVDHNRRVVADATYDKAANIASYITELGQSALIDSHFDISKYPRLRIASSSSSSSSSYSEQKTTEIRSMFKLRRRKSDFHAVMSFSTVPITKSLLKLDNISSSSSSSSEANDYYKLSIEAFQILLCIMGDKAVSTLGSSIILSDSPKTISQLSVYQSMAWLTMDLITAITTRYNNDDDHHHHHLRDECYFQLAKQVSENPNINSRIHGWLLMSIYLHSFRPSTDAFQYIKNFIHSSEQSMARELVTPSTNAAGDVDTDDDKDDQQLLYDIQKVLNIISYCKLSINQMQEDNSNEGNSNNKQPKLSLSKPLIERIYSQEGLSFEVIAMTGSIYRFSIPYGQCSTIASILLLLYDQMCPDDEYFHCMHYSFQQAIDDDPGISPSSSSSSDTNIAAMDHASNYFSNDSKLKRVMNLFRGYSLYTANQNDYDESLTDIVLEHIPVQPKMKHVIDFDRDIQWDLLCLHVSQSIAINESDVHHDVSSNESMYEVFKNTFPVGNTFILRRKMSVLNEQLACEFELFREQVAMDDVTTMQSLWETWLNSTEGGSSSSSILPSDHVRVDLTFAEDCRYVNSSLYPLSRDSFQYLLAIQLSLAWMMSREDAESSLSGDGGGGLVVPQTSSTVRPCYAKVYERLLIMIPSMMYLNSSCSSSSSRTSSSSSSSTSSSSSRTSSSRSSSSHSSSMCDSKLSLCNLYVLIAIRSSYIHIHAYLLTCIH